MLQTGGVPLAPQTKIFLSVESVDFRKGHDGLSFVCRQKLEQDPFSGALFVFRNRARNALKLLCYDGQGLWGIRGGLPYKRLSKGKLNWWPTEKTNTISLKASELQILLWNGNPTGAKIPEDWRKISGAAFR